MGSYTGTSAATRGSVGVTGTPSPSPSPFWIDEARDNLNLITPSPVVNTDNDSAIEASWIQPSPAAYYTAVCSRYFVAFSTAGVPTQANSIQLYVHTRTSADNDLRIVKASAPSTTGNIDGGDYKAIPGLTSGTGMGGLVTDYYNGDVTPSIGWNAIPLNAAAISDFNSQPELRIAIVDSTYDYNYTEPTAPSTQRTGISSGVTSAPYLLVETGIDQWVLSINPASTFKVNSVTGTNIRLVNRVFYLLYRTNASAGCPLSFPGVAAIYCAVPLALITNGTTVYTDSSLTTPFVGGGLVYGFHTAISGSWIGFQFTISNAGVVTATSDCGF